VLSWHEQLADAKKEIAELEVRVSALRAELQTAQWATDAARLQGVLAVREQHLVRAKFHAQFIESRIAKGQRATKPIPYAALANICYKEAQRTARLDTAETLKPLAKSFSARAKTEVSRRLFESDGPERKGGRTYSAALSPTRSAK
jgi:hypothetical protein